MRTWLIRCECCRFWALLERRGVFLVRKREDDRNAGCNFEGSGWNSEYDDEDGFSDGFYDFSDEGNW